MADDLNRDIIYLDTCRSSIDPRERHTVCKLDRYQLEDKYLRLLEEASNLKKLSNSQEDKIKQLSTKLRRVTANPRACPIALDVYDHKNKIAALEAENSRLKDKISVLRNQLLSHTIISRSPSRSRNCQPRVPSGRITCRSESSRTKIPSCHYIIQSASDDNTAQNNVDKIMELEAQKEEMSARISQLEQQLSATSVINQKQKVAENVEYIKVWRQMNLLNEKLEATESENAALSAQLNDLKRMLEEKTKLSEEMMSELLKEKKRGAETDQQLLKAKESELSLREKDEQIKDLLSELTILRQHNKELIDLSTKYGEIELENKELKRKISEQNQDQKSLKNTVDVEQTNIIALHASNEQLLEKLDDLQKNIDNLTVQLMCLQTQTEKQESSMSTQASTKRRNLMILADNHDLYAEMATQVEKYNKCCETFGNILQVDLTNTLKDFSASIKETMDKTQQTKESMDRSMQTDDPLTSVEVDPIDEEIMRPVKESPKANETQMNAQSVNHAPALTAEKMLKLLEEAQINPAIGFSPKHADFNEMLEQDQRHRQVVSLEKLLFGDSNC